MSKDLIKKFGIGCLLVFPLLLYVWNSNIKHEAEFINVKYRQEEVDIAHPRWEFLDTQGSSFIQGAWYDQKEEYMIIRLSGTYYHYCAFPSSVWRNFKSTSSFGGDYNRYIKGNYDCREHRVPQY